jgi:hypothetical protein
MFRRFPSREQLAPVYAVAVLMLYTWTILWFFWKLPSWIFFMNAGEILITFMYSLATNFVESLIVLCAPILLCLLLPRQWFHDVFVARGSSVVLAGLGYMMYIAFQFQTKNDYPSLSLKGWSVALAALLILFIVFITGKISISRKVLEVVADRATIFLYVSIPASLIAVLVVLVHSVI